MSTRSTSLNISDFLNQKVQEVELNSEYTTRYRAVFREAYKENRLAKDDWNKLREKLKMENQSSKSEFVTSKRQRKMIENDMAEANIHKTVENAYTKMMLNRIKLSKERNFKKHTQEKSRLELEKYYEVARVKHIIKAVDLRCY